VLGGSDHTLYLRDLTTTDKDRLLWKGRQPQGIRLAFSRDGTLLASAGWDSTIRLWDVATGRRLPADLPQSHEGWVYAAVALPDGQHIVTADSGGQVLLWDVVRRRVIRNFDGHTGRVWCLGLSRDGKTLASGGTDQTIRLWEVSSGRELRKIAVRGQVKCLSFSPDGQRLASAIGEDRYPTWMKAAEGAGVQVWETASGERDIPMGGHAGGVKAVAFSPNGKTLATAGNDGTVRLCSPYTGKERLKLVGGKGAVEAIAFSPDSELIAATGQDEKVWLWRVESGERLFEVKGPRGWGLSLAFSPDGRTLASTSFQDTVYDQAGARLPARTVRLWEVATGKERAQFEGHQGTAHALAFFANGTGLISGGADGTVLLWDLTGRRIGAPPMPAGPAWDALLSPDGALAQRAIWSLVAQPQAAMPRLRGALRPVPGAQAGRIAGLIKDLDDDAFKVREKAWRELEAIGEPAVKALREALKSPSAEVRDRAAQLLEKIQGQQLSGERLRQWRAMEVLEQLEHPGAVALLKALARGAPEAKRTQQAKAALVRRPK
jgi:WD40 repeat protein